ncbi:hypothetical protein [Dankookia sp. P2]|uniref:hypothetical protein n=1 Tax=Dankookia sp. P2 TaxID=3423955 RepID=UPI003D67F2D7
MNLNLELLAVSLPLALTVRGGVSTPVPVDERRDRARRALERSQGTGTTARRS